MRIQSSEIDEEDRHFKSGKVRKDRAQRDRGRIVYEGRPFLSWDGEGYNVWEVSGDGTVRSRHKYCLFGCSDSECITGIDLGTQECFSLLLRKRQEHPSHIHVAFAFEYDVNMMLRDLPKWAVRRLKKNGWAVWSGYRIEHRPKKWFTLSATLLGKKVSVRVYDIFSFFSCSFVAALEQYYPECPELAQIKSGKERRSQFGFHELEYVRSYWLVEQRAMVELGNRLRNVLYSAGIRISSWHGPGAIATFLYKKHGTRSVLARSDNLEIENASRHAYAGGRFELFRCGHYEGPVYSYDINSAYPYAISGLPDMASGTWRHTADPHEIRTCIESGNTRLGYIRIDWHPPYEWVEQAIYNAMPMPLWHRAPNGTVSYPPLVQNWYHIDEVTWAVFQREEYRTLLEAWIYEDDGTYPFEWVAETYEQRLAWKQEGNPAEWALKLGLNSLYGKTAQRVGWDQEKMLPPSWHQLDWAGLDTSTCRSMLYPPMMEAFEASSLLSVETDSVFSTRRLTNLPNGLGTGLGQWKESVYDGITLVQSGMYWLKDGNTWLPPKSRGIPRERLDHDSALRALRGDVDTGVVKASHTSFVGYGRALAQNYEEWRTWKSSPREYRIGGDGKRVHDAGKCRACHEGIGFDEGLHTLRVGRIEGTDSVKHGLPWRDGGTASYHDEFDEERRWAVRI
jgi:hypothetical protein